MGVRIKVVVVSAAAALAATLTLVPAAQASFPSVYGGDLSCAAQPANGNIRFCSGATKTWDETKVDVNVILPPAPASGPDGPYPLIGDFHGWGGSKIGINPQTQGWAEHGYAVFSMSDRGWGESCGATDPDRISMSAECAQGYNHLMDDRYEVRDAQYLISVLADEGVAQPQKIGSTGMSYGGGISMALAALRNRTILPDGSLVPWESPAGTPMEISAAVPQWPWTDLAYALMPNGRTLDYVADAPYLGPEGKAPIGVEKASYVSGLYGTGLASSNYAAPGTDPGADLTSWFTLVSAGEPYDSNPAAAAIIAEITSHHSSYYIDHSEAPAPLLIQSGWNDDLFPPDEAIRFYNRTRNQYPGDPISLFFMDDGHARSQNKPADVEVFEARQNAWFDHYLKGAGPAPESSVEALTTTCATPSEGPYTADSWKDLAPGEIRLDSATEQTVVPGSGDPSINQKFDPIAGEGACASASGADQSGAANYRLPAAPAAGYTLMGSPTIVGDIASAGSEGELVARLLDVAPGGTETLVARGLLRPGTGGTGMVFQLHPQAYRFAAGHVAKLELLPSDAPYARPSNAQTPIEVSNLELRLPVLEHPGELEGLVKAPAPKVVPPGYELAIDYRGAKGEENEGGGKGGSENGGKGPVGNGPGDNGSATVAKGVTGLSRGRIRATRRMLLLRLHCAGPTTCSGTLAVSRAPRGATLASGPYSIAPGQALRLRLPLTAAGRKIVAAGLRKPGSRPLPARLAFTDLGRPILFELTRPIHLKR
jgi:predicted acyl esterase